jgi:hypothetical protein
MLNYSRALVGARTSIVLMRNLRVAALGCVAWLVAFLVGVHGLWVFVFPALVVCLVHVALAFQLVAGSALSKLAVSVLVPLPGLLLQWKLAEISALGGSVLEQASLVLTWQAIAVLSFVACVPAAASFLRGILLRRGSQE